MRLLAEYTGHRGSVGEGVSLVGTWIDSRAPAPIHGLDVTSAEVLRAVARNGWTSGADDQFLLVLQPGASVDPDVLTAQCALHSVGIRSDGKLFSYALIAFPSNRCAASVGATGGDRVAELCAQEEGYRFDGLWIPELWDRVHRWCSGGIG